MLKTTFTLISKKELTHDVFELIYSCPELEKEMPKPGQYVMFQLAPWLSRAYSISEFNISPLNKGGWRGDSIFTLIIKRIAEGRWSPIICDAEIGTTFSGMLPLGHFTLQDTPKTKCFIGTGTGFAPLYCMVRTLSMRKFSGKVAFLYGVREECDFFYLEEMNAFKEKLDLTLLPYLSRDDQEYATRGYVTDWINQENITPYEEFYLCGSPTMVKDAREKLETLGVQKEQIFWEQY